MRFFSRTSNLRLVSGAFGYLAVGLVGCARDRMTPTESISTATIGADVELATAIDTALSLVWADKRVQLRALPDLVVTDGDSPTAAENVASALLPRSASRPQIQTWLSTEAHRVFVVSAARSGKDSTVWNQLTTDTSLDFAVPAYVSVAHPSDTLYFANRIAIEFISDQSDRDLRDFEARTGVSLLRKASKDSGLVYHIFRYPTRTRNPVQVLRALNRIASVRLAAPDYLNSAARTQVPNDPFYAQQFNLNSSAFRNGFPVDTRAELAWTINRGGGLPSNGGTRIAVIDDGVWANHPDLVGRVSASGINRVNDGVDPTNPPMPFQHGTAVSGLIVASQDNSTGISGLAPEATVYSIKVIRLVGSTETYYSVDFANGIDQARTLFNVDIISMSIGGPGDNDALISAALSRARTQGRGGKGIVLVSASGNSGANSLLFPAGEPGVISVGALTPTGVRALYSNGGSTLSVVAPSSTDLNGPYCGSDGPPSTAIATASCSGIGLSAGYIRFGGTSAAAPQVAAVAALVLTRYPTMTGDAVKSRIMAQADAWGAATDFGAGKVNAYLALVGRLSATIPGQTLVNAGVVTRTCSASNGTGTYSYHWYQSYTGDESSLFDTGVTTASLSVSINSGETFLLRCVASDGVQSATVNKTLIAN